MKILKLGRRKEPEYLVVCKECGAEFLVELSETDQIPGDEFANYFTIGCPNPDCFETCTLTVDVIPAR